MQVSQLINILENCYSREDEVIAFLWDDSDVAFLTGREEIGPELMRQIDRRLTKSAGVDEYLLDNIHAIIGSIVSEIEPENEEN